jgi:hypothetical protein
MMIGRSSELRIFTARVENGIECDRAFLVEVIKLNRDVKVANSGLSDCGNPS